MRCQEFSLFRILGTGIYLYLDFLPLVPRNSSGGHKSCASFMDDDLDYSAKEPHKS